MSNDLTKRSYAGHKWFVIGSVGFRMVPDEWFHDSRNGIFPSACCGLGIRISEIWMTNVFYPQKDCNFCGRVPVGWSSDASGWLMSRAITREPAG